MMPMPGCRTILVTVKWFHGSTWMSTWHWFVLNVSIIYDNQVIYRTIELYIWDTHHEKDQNEKKPIKAKFVCNALEACVLFKETLQGWLAAIKRLCHTTTYFTVGLVIYSLHWYCDRQNFSSE